MNIEKMNKENFDNFISLLREFKESEKNRYLNSTLINRLKEDAFSINPKYEVYLGKIGQDWVAYVIIVMLYSTLIALPSVSVEEMFVLDSFRSLGIGAAMLEFCIRTVRKKGCGKIEFMVPARNKKAKKFFEFNEAVLMDMSYYQMDLVGIKKIGTTPGKITHVDFIRKKRTNKLSLFIPS